MHSNFERPLDVTYHVPRASKLAILAQIALKWPRSELLGLGKICPDCPQNWSSLIFWPKVPRGVWEIWPIKYLGRPTVYMPWWYSLKLPPIIKQKLLFISAQNQQIVHVCACFPIQHTYIAFAAYDFFPLTKSVTNVVGPSPVAYQTSVGTSCIALYYPKMKQLIKIQMSCSLLFTYFSNSNTPFQGSLKYIYWDQTFMFDA